MQANQLNVEYWFRVLYECFHGGCYGSNGLVGLSAFLANLWVWIIIIGYILSAIGLFVIIYCTVRLFELRKREEEYYGTLLVAPGHDRDVNHRWIHIQSLIASTNASDWRTAIIEADIMLDDMLKEQGYVGEGIGERLKLVESSDFSTLNDAWEAHKVRNQIAHEGSSFNLSDTLARRTIARYESVFREFDLI